MLISLGTEVVWNAVLAGLVAITTATSPLDEAATDAAPLGAFDTRLLAAHNLERAAMGAPPMRWNPALAEAAEEWAERLAARKALVHSISDPDDPDPQGENLWMGTRGYYTPEDMVGLWIAEKQHYRPGVFPAVSATGRWSDIGHYTQVIWASSREVGCALARNNEDEFLVCRYAEGGNVIGERPV